jgi:CheY-like chemotaxis protein
MGGPGCGKTVFALQALVNGAQQAHEAGVFVAFEESTSQIVANAATFGSNSLRAIANVKAICDEHFAARHKLEIVDLLDHPARALADGIIVTPTLLKLLPLPVQRLSPALRVIDLLLTDVVMPQMGGAEAASRLLAVRPSLKLLYMSGYTDNAVALHGVLRSEAAFMQKPITPAALLSKVREVLDSP